MIGWLILCGRDGSRFCCSRGSISEQQNLLRSSGGQICSVGTAATTSGSQWRSDLIGHSSCVVMKTTKASRRDALPVRRRGCDTVVATRLVTLLAAAVVNQEDGGHS
ncbi:hypothetical protein TSUD_315980 [Trifolium subterraneum]|uniref:Uncharacterized protein n=1 Tax=Trifolium subterraneum TaxID=3900 RepID=A0A2Z6MNA3_TRISU|nr:hypothetical protein TSUD_315980 [Trifolium subterraneum]